MSRAARSSSGRAATPPRRARASRHSTEHGATSWNGRATTSVGATTARRRASYGIIVVSTHDAHPSDDGGVSPSLRFDGCNTCYLHNGVVGACVLDLRPPSMMTKHDMNDILIHNCTYDTYTHFASARCTVLDLRPPHAIGRSPRYRTRCTKRSQSTMHGARSQTVRQRCTIVHGGSIVHVPGATPDVYEMRRNEQLRDLRGRLPLPHSSIYVSHLFLRSAALICLYIASVPSPDIEGFSSSSPCGSKGNGIPTLVPRTISSLLSFPRRSSVGRALLDGDDRRRSHRHRPRRSITRTNHRGTTTTAPRRRRSTATHFPLPPPPFHRPYVSQHSTGNGILPLDAYVRTYARTHVSLSCEARAR